MQTLLLADLIGTELQSRTEAKRILTYISSSTYEKDIVIDFQGVMFISRSFADEFCEITEQHKLTHTIDVINKNEYVETVLDIVLRNRYQPKNVPDTGETKTFRDMDSLSEFLLTI
ncbi:hypothetical protein EZS27_002292 [termite gut metagenome]|uniref:DUF4325 domain-containing protein n=1 Tax=termite gut metagenome TaxID=433724 RepID=A0A5J4SVT4_9ZZZZ